MFFNDLNPFIIVLFILLSFFIANRSITGCSCAILLHRFCIKIYTRLLSNICPRQFQNHSLLLLANAVICYFLARNNLYVWDKKIWSIICLFYPSFILPYFPLPCSNIPFTMMSFHFRTFSLCSLLSKDYCTQIIWCTAHWNICNFIECVLE